MGPIMCHTRYTISETINPIKSKFEDASITLRLSKPYLVSYRVETSSECSPRALFLAIAFLPSHFRVVPAVFRTHLFAFFAVQETRTIFLSLCISKVSICLHSFGVFHSRTCVTSGHTRQKVVYTWSRPVCCDCSILPTVMLLCFFCCSCFLAQ